MPWREQGNGFTTARGGHITNVPQYEKLKAKYGKRRAAAITNSFHHKRGPKHKEDLVKAHGPDDGGVSQILVLQGPRRRQPIEKYQRGTITYHQEQANLHSRKRTSGQRQAGYGAGAAGLGVTAALGSAGIGQTHGAAAGRLAERGGMALAAGGAGLAAVGAGRAIHHGIQRNKHVKAAQEARRQRNVTLKKAAPAEFGRGVRIGVRLANKGHSPVGPFGSGVAGRKTYTVRPGGSKAKRAGIHLGVAAARTPSSVPLLAGGGAGGAVIERRHLRKAADRRDAAAAILGAGAAGTGFNAAQHHRRAKGQRQAATLARDSAQSHYRVAEARMGQHAMPRGTKGHVPMTPNGVRNTANELFMARAADVRAGAHARNAIHSTRAARGRAGAAVALAGGAAAVATHKREPRYSSVGYR